MFPFNDDRWHSVPSSCRRIFLSGGIDGHITDFSPIFSNSFSRLLVFYLFLFSVSSFFYGLKLL